MGLQGVGRDRVTDTLSPNTPAFVAFKPRLSPSIVLGASFWSICFQTQTFSCSRVLLDVRQGLIPHKRPTLRLIEPGHPRAALKVSLGKSSKKSNW